MKVLIPMAGAGSRFSDAGYLIHKPCLPISSRLGPGQLPMVVAAVNDLPVAKSDTDSEIIFVIRDFHSEDGVRESIRKYYPHATFIQIDHLTEGQACTCLLAKDFIDTNDSLIISACDNGIDVDEENFQSITEQADAVIFVFRHQDTVLDKPEAYGWIQTEGDRAVGVSIKKPISKFPMEDPAVVGTFWFRSGHDFIAAAEGMIAADDRINGEFYVDQVFKYLIDSGKVVKIFDVDRYICWGTPADYIAYEKTISYWTDFIKEERDL
jgi:dTDP-glucose pyrophosphorylase